MTFADINIRDPFIVLEDDTYYMYGTRGAECWNESYGLDVYTSTDLETWSEPTEVFTPPVDFWANKNFWAPEVHKYNGAYYMFASFKADGVCRGTQILRSDSPMGPFVLHSDGPVTPRDWECLDGTLYVDKNGIPYMIFCHEWVQVKDGEMCVMRLTDDLKAAAEEPKLLFKASEPSWANKGVEDYVTDGPFMHRLADGTLIMLWSSIAQEAYVEAIAVSDNGDITGNWKQLDELLFDKDGGHGMVFRDKTGDLRFIMHSPNKELQERPVLITVREENGTLVKA